VLEDVLRAKQRAIDARAASFRKPRKLTREQRYSSFNNAGTMRRALQRCEAASSRSSTAQCLLLDEVAHETAFKLRV
jgi:hypothetical protein